MTPTLWHIEVSHYNEKARWALDYKQIPHVRKAPMPGLTGFYALALTRGGQRRFPVLTLDGKRIGDSTAIIAALEEHTPDPPLYPEDPVERARALELEDYFDEELGPALRRVVWFYTLDDSDAVVDTVMTGGSPARRRLMGILAPVARPIIKRDYSIDEEGAVEALATVRAAMDRLERELGSNAYLVGDRFSVADLAAASMFTPILCPPARQYPPKTMKPELLEIRAELEAREGGRWIGEMFARHRGVSAEVAG